MKKLTFSVLLAVLYPSLQLQLLSAQTVKKTKPAPLKIKFHKNIEFMGFAFSLGSIQYKNKKKDYNAYQLNIHEKYKSFKDDPDLIAISSYLERIEDNALIIFALQLKDFPHAFVPRAMKEKYLLPFSKNGKVENARADAEEFLTLLNRFYKKVEFNTYLSVNEPLYKAALKELTNIRPSAKPEPKKFFRRQFKGYGLIPSLTIPMEMAFATHLREEG